MVMFAAMHVARNKKKFWLVLVGENSWWKKITKTRGRIAERPAWPPLTMPDNACVMRCQAFLDASAMRA